MYVQQRFVNITNPHDYKLIVNSNICDDSTVLSLTFVVVKPDDFYVREKIRSTWANKEQFPNFKVIFSLGLSLDRDINEKVINESRIHKDIIQEDFIDSYFNLTLKIMMTLKWVKYNCQQAEYVVESITT